MDIRTNEFVEMPEEQAERDYMIPFNVGEECELKGYRFEVHQVDVESNVLILKPIGITKDEARKRKVKDFASKHKAKGGLGGV